MKGSSQILGSKSKIYIQKHRKLGLDAEFNSNCQMVMHTDAVERSQQVNLRHFLQMENILVNCE